SGSGSQGTSRSFSVHNGGNGLARSRGIANCLIRAALEGFELVIVADKNLWHQQNLTKRRVAILELWTNHRPTLERHFVRIRDAVQSATKGQYIVLKQERE